MASLASRCSLLCLLVFVVSVCASVNSEEEDGDVFQWRLPMPTPGQTPPKHNDYRCRASELPHKDNYIVRYEPRADPNIAHHMLVYGCSALSYKLKDSSSWNCKSSTVCAALDIPKIIYAWALNASGFQLPPGVGQKVGPETNINYIIVQIHYGEIDAADLSESAESHLALILHMTSQRQQRVSGVYLLGSSSILQSGRENATADTMCKFDGPKSIVPIAFRTHAHAHSTLIVGYVGNGADSWKEIGFRSPQDPQAFYPVSSAGITVNPGDWLASRCVYNTSSRAQSIHMGPDSEDEMCNFYIMYHTENDGRPLISSDCWEPAPPDTHYPPLPVLPPSHKSHHHHNHALMGGGSDGDDIVMESTQNTPKPITSSTTLPGGSEEDNNYMCPSSVPPNQAPSKCVEATPTNQPPGNEGANEEFHLYPVKDWLYNDANLPLLGADSGKGGILGQVTSVAMAADGSVLVLHRGPRVWDMQTFTYTNMFVDAEEGPISTPTVLKFSSQGVLEQVWGAGLFYLPHSITVDHLGHIWITDVAMHQVFKFDGLGADEPSLTLGHKLTPGSKPGYFCKPADVAVSSSGTFYVADGYCNSRVVAYNSNGVMKNILGNYPIDKKMMFIAHSLALSPAQDQLYVADRENKRILSIEVSDGKVRVFSAGLGLGRVFGIGFSGARDGGWPLLTVSVTDDGESGYGLAIDAEGDVEMIWSIEQKFAKVHDLVVDAVSKSVYVAELDPPMVWKFISLPENSSPSDHDSPSTTEQPLGTTEEPQSTSEHQTSATEQPQGTTEEPESTTEQPPVTTEQPQDTTEQPEGTTEQPQGTTEQPHNTTEQPQNTTQPTATDQPQDTKTDHSTDSTMTTPPTDTASPTHTTLTTPEFHDNDTGSGLNSPATNSSSSGDSSPSSSDSDGEAKVEMGSDKADTSHHSFDSKSSKRVATPVYHYGLFAAIFAIVGLILVVVIGILKEHRYCRFRSRKMSRAAAESGIKTPRDTLHSLLGPSKLGFSRLRTYDSDSEVEEFPIFSRQS